MRDYLHFDYEMSVSATTTDQCLALKSYASKLGFASVIFQASVTHANKFSNNEIQRLKALGWGTYEIEQLERYGFDQQPSFIRYIGTQHKPFCLDLNEIGEMWRTKGDFQSFKSVMSRRQIRYAVMVPIHLPFNCIGYSCWFSAQPYSLEPFVKHMSVQLQSSSLRFHETISLDHASQPSMQLPNLSSKEWQCLYLASKGMTEKEMASALTRSADTVKFHLRNAAKKLSAKNRTQAVALALQLGMIKA